MYEALAYGSGCAGPKAGGSPELLVEGDSAPADNASSLAAAVPEITGDAHGAARWLLHATECQGAHAEAPRRRRQQLRIRY